MSENSETKNYAERYEKLYSMLLEAIPSSVLLINRDMRIVSANRNFLEKGRHSMTETMGQRLESVFPAVILDDMDIINRIRQVIENNQPTQGERMTYRAPGVPLQIYYYTILPFSWQGSIEGAMILMDDVTEQVRLSEEVRRIERHLVSVVESASDIVLSTDIDGRILTWNGAAERFTGLTSSEVSGRFFFEFCAENSRKDIKTIFRRINATEISQMKEYSLVTRQGTYIPISWVFSHIRDYLNQVTGIVAVGRDMTERVKFELQLLQSQKLAALGVMAGGIAHEIRNPLAICSSAAQFLMEDDLTEDFRKECADKIHKAIQHTSTIIENLLKFAHPSVRTSAARIDLVSLIGEALTMVAHHASIYKVEMKSALPHESVIIIGVADLLQQVFMNIFLNAINAMPDGGALDLTMAVKDQEVAVYVKDTGHGISKKTIDKIFDPFYTTSAIGKGTGLGLSLCYSIVKQHAGLIEVESIEGEGSVFTVRLPLPENKGGK